MKRQNIQPDTLSKRVVGGHVLYSHVVVVEAKKTIFVSGQLARDAKGAGEGSLVPVSPAVGNALARLTGIRFRELPLTPERVWRALRQRDP